MATTTGQWQVSAPGRAATLNVEGENLPGEATTVVATWTSHWFVPRRGIALTLHADSTHYGVTAPGAVQDWSVQTRWREGRGRWSVWAGRASNDYNVYPALTVTWAGGDSWASFHDDQRLAWQFQVRLHLTSTDVSRSVAALTVHAAK